MAAFFYFSAFFKGLPVAQDNLAFMSYTYYPQAATWTPRAAEQGYAQAQTDLGYLYKQGKGVSLNTSPPTPGTILRLPAEGDRRAAARMKSLSSIMTREQVTTASAGGGAPRPEPESYVPHEFSPQEPRSDPTALTRPWPAPFSD